MAADSGGKCEPIQLEPFIYQVGGRSSMLQFDECTICKPLIPQELNFYSSIPESLKPYTPEYGGVIEVNFAEDKDGYLILTAYPPETCRLLCQKLHQNKSALWKKNGEKTKHRIRLQQSGIIEIESSPKDETPIFEEAESSRMNGVSPLNPWVLHCHQEQIKKMRTTPSGAVHIRKFILLENLTSKYQFPCILDLKMGTRQHGDDASLSKRQSHQARVASTTSGTLGVRICGMQVYHMDSGHFICHNKYYGRSLTVEGFKQALYHFLHNGNKLRQDIIPQLIDHLRQLHSVIKCLDTFRFFTSSLLIIYDGKEGIETSVYNGNGLVEDSEGHVMLQLLDNGNRNRAAGSTAEKPQNSVCDDLTVENRNAPVVGDVSGEWATQFGPSVYSKSHPTRLGRDGSSVTSAIPLVEVRMIDFAHSTHSDMPGVKTIHSGPDDGYLFGLENLIAQLKDFQQD